MIVDDHELIRQGICRLIAETGRYEVCGEAENGKEAIHKSEELKPDMVILDISMPVMGGIEATPYIRELLPAVKILIVTVHEAKQLEDIVKVSGANALLRKPEQPHH